MSGAGRGNTVDVGGMNHGLNITGRGDGNGNGGQQYEMFDVDEQGSQSQCGSHSGSGGPSSVGTCYDDAPSDGFEDPGRGNDLAFGDRIY